MGRYEATIRPRVDACRTTTAFTKVYFQCYVSFVGKNVSNVIIFGVYGVVLEFLIFKCACVWTSACVYAYERMRWACR